MDNTILDMLDHIDRQIAELKEQRKDLLELCDHPRIKVVDGYRENHG